MALNTSKFNHLTPMRFNGLSHVFTTMTSAQVYAVQQEITVAPKTYFDYIQSDTDNQHKLIQYVSITILYCTRKPAGLG